MSIDYLLLARRLERAQAQQNDRFNTASGGTLAFVSDVGRAADSANDRAGRLATLAGQAIKATPGTDPDRLLAWLQKKRPVWSGALSAKRYAELRRGMAGETP